MKSFYDFSFLEKYGRVFKVFAFALFADGNRTEDSWPLSGKLFAVVKKATNDERSERQQSVEELLEEWGMTI